MSTQTVDYDPLRNRLKYADKNIKNFSPHKPFNISHSLIIIYIYIYVCVCVCMCVCVCVCVSVKCKC